VLRWDGTADAVLTILADATLPLPEGFTFSLLHRGPLALKVSYVGASGVSVVQVNVVEDVTTLWQRGMATFFKDGPDSWTVTGGFKAVA
jgi:hypothetical protein